MSINSADQISSVSDDGTISYVIPEKTETVQLESIKVQIADAEWAVADAQGNFDRAQSHLTSKQDALTKLQAIYDAAIAANPKADTPAAEPV